MLSSQSGKERRYPAPGIRTAPAVVIRSAVPALFLILTALVSCAWGQAADVPVVDRVEFEGNTLVDDGALRDVVGTERASFLRSRRLDRRQLEEDEE